MEGGRHVVSATFVTPYPPGFPVLVPGQLFSQQILSYMDSLDTPEIHGYRPDLGYRVFTDQALAGDLSDDQSAALASRRASPPPDERSQPAQVSPAPSQAAQPATASTVPDVVLLDQAPVGGSLG